ncbi:MAG: hypothetical protein ACOYXT_08760 [Bacteroidota bacterium]
MKVFPTFGTLLLFCLAFYAPHTFAQNRHLPDIILTIDDDTFPSSWLSGEINGKASPLDSGEFERSRRIIVKALSKYPPAVIQKHLKKVHVVKHLEFYGQSYGGTNSTDAVYITNKGAAMGYTDFWIEQTFHQEFSSILFRNYSFLFDRKKWTSCNKDILYGTSGVDALKQGKTSLSFDLELNKKGILSEYGTASIEEDFNTFAENLFLSSTGFWEIVRTQKRIKKKAEQVMEFYRAIDNKFSEAYFRGVSGN